MSKQLFTRDEVKTILREAINRQQKPTVEDNKPEKAYTGEEVEALIHKDHEARKTS